MRRRHQWLLTIPIIVFCALIAMKQQRIEQLGTFHFPISCRADSQAAFNRAMSLFHGAWVQEARKGFAGLTETDPDCAMAYWGFAMTMLANPLRPPFSPMVMREGWAAVVQAKHLGGPTPREQA